MVEIKLISADELRRRQDEYISKFDDTQMQHIIVTLNDAYKKPERYKTYDMISEHNIAKLRNAGYKVEYMGSQIDSYYYKVSW